jgi:hypothetical protein
LLTSRASRFGPPFDGSCHQRSMPNSTT